MALTAAYECIPSPRCRAGPGLPALPTTGPFWHPAPELGTVGQGTAVLPTPLLPQPAWHLGDHSPATVIWGGQLGIAGPAGRGSQHNVGLGLPETDGL